MESGTFHMVTPLCMVKLFLAQYLVTHNNYAHDLRLALNNESMTFLVLVG
jgi:hypothetical protein